MRSRQHPETWLACTCTGSAPRDAAAFFLLDSLALPMADGRGDSSANGRQVRSIEPTSEVPVSEMAEMGATAAP